MSAEEYAIREADLNDDYEQVKQYMLEKFTVQELIQHSYLLSHLDEITSYDHDLMRMSETSEMSSIFHNGRVLVVVRREDNGIVGFIAMQSYNVQTGMGEDDHIRGFITSGASVPKLYFELAYVIRDMIETADLAGRYPDVEDSIRLRFLFVDEEYRGQGLAKALVRAAVHQAKLEGCRLVHGLFTSVRAKSAATAAGLTSICDFDLSTYHHDNDDSRPCFVDSGPNNVVSIMTADPTTIIDEGITQYFELEDVSYFESA